MTFQYLAGGSVDKQRIARRLVGAACNVLEVGCSVGKFADGLRNLTGLRYTGVDVDCVAIDLARRRFRQCARFNFHCETLTQFANRGSRFDLVLVAGILHHLDDRESAEVLRAAAALTQDGGRVGVIEPLPASRKDGLLLSFYANTLEQGRYLRDRFATVALLESARLSITSIAEQDVHATPFRWPVVARFLVVDARHASDDQAAAT